MSEEKFTGRVKWFDNKNGIGFITVVEGEKKDSDIFVHHQSIVVSSEQFRYLVQGEYVEFLLVPASANNKDKFQVQADSVSGICGGQLMCETKNENRSTRVSVPRSVSTRGSGPREELLEMEPVKEEAVWEEKKKPRGRGRPSKNSLV